MPGLSGISFFKIERGNLPIPRRRAMLTVSALTLTITALSLAILLAPQSIHASSVANALGRTGIIAIISSSGVLSAGSLALGAVHLYKPSISTKHSPPAPLSTPPIHDSITPLQKEYAAIIIQRMWRNRLPPSIYHTAITAIETTKTETDTSGKTPVKLPETGSVIIKYTQPGVAVERFQKMRQARRLCSKHGYKNLSIPKARIHQEKPNKEILIEGRLPIDVYATTKTQIGLYSTHPEAFNQAVKDFVGFLFHANLDDISDTNQRYQALAGKEAPLGRYDNIPLYIEGGIGKIALIDLERFSLRQENDPVNNLNRCALAISLFPLHFSQILETASQLDSTIKDDNPYLTSIRDKYCKIFANIFTRHAQFLEKHQITLNNPICVAPVVPERATVITQAVISRIQELHEGALIKEGIFFGQGCLGKDSQQPLQLLQEQMVGVINQLHKNLQEMLKEEWQDRSSSTKEVWDFANFRTLLFENSLYLTKGISTLLTEIPLIRKNSGLNQFDDSFSLFLAKAILSEMAKEGGEIVYYNPNMQGNTQCLML